MGQGRIKPGAELKIGFDISQTGVMKAGCGYFADAMIRILTGISQDNKYVLFPTFGDYIFDPGVNLQKDTYRAKSALFGPDHTTREAAARFWTSPNLDNRLPGIDILHANNFWCPRQPIKARLVYTLYDLSFLEEPNWHTEANRSYCFAGMFGAAITADWIVAISKSTRDCFLRTFPSFPAERIKVIYPSSRFTDVDALGKRPDHFKNVQAGRFWLSVGTIEPRKNQKRLLEAFARYLAAGGERIPLVLAGGAGWLMEEFTTFITELGISDSVVLTGYVTDDELIWLYRNCYANVYVSLYEGFGLPVLEGMQFGAATIASKSTSLPEIAQDAAILVDPLATDEITATLLDLARNPARRDALSGQAQRRAADFKPEQSAKALLELYDQVIASPKHAKPPLAELNQPARFELGPSGSSSPTPAQTKVSIVTPSYNQGEFLERTIESVLSQNWPSLEYFIFDGGSTDSTIDILWKYGDRVQWESQKDQGQADAVNKGLEALTGDIIGWLNSDDVYYPGAIECVIEYFSEHPDVDVVYGMADHIDANDKPFEPYPTEQWDFQRLKWTCFLCQPAVFFRRSVVERNGLLDVNLKYCMDYEYWLRLGAAGVCFGYLEQKLAGSRMYPSNKTLGQRVQAHQEIVEMFRQRFGYASPRWLSNYAVVVAEAHKLEIERSERRRTAELEGELNAERGRAAELEAALHAVTHSTAWRSTAPIRHFGSRFRRTSRFARRVLKLLWWTLTLQLVTRLKPHIRRILDAKHFH